MEIVLLVLDLSSVVLTVTVKVARYVFDRVGNEAVSTARSLGKRGFSLELVYEVLSGKVIVYDHSREVLLPILWTAN